MTVSTLTSSITYTGNGATTAFPVPFKVLDEDHLVVRRRIAATGVLDYTYIGTDYSYSGIGADSGTLTLDGAALTSTYKLEIERIVPYTQPLDIVNAGGFYPETVEEQFDLTTMQIQQINTKTNRAVLLPFGMAVPEDWEDVVELFKGDTGAPGSGNLVGFSVDDYCTTNTAAGNTAGMAALAAAVNAADGGVIDFTPGKTYVVGAQTANNPAIASYTFTPAPLLVFSSCTRPIIIRGNGAKMQCAPGLKYGTFDTSGAPTSHAMPYTGPEAAAPYNYMIRVLNCGAFHIENLELDGNHATWEIGGDWGDTGIQIGASGLVIDNSTGPFSITGINSHHHGTDGIIINCPATGLAATLNNGLVSHSRFEFNGRQGMSFVGGVGWTFLTCSFNHTWRLSATATTEGPLNTAPGGGVDIEAEGGKKVRRLRFETCEFINNGGPAMVADSGDSENVSFHECKFVGTTSWSLWSNKPRFTYHKCTFVGALVSLYGNANPALPAKFFDCMITNDVTASPTGSVYGSGATNLIGAGYDNVLFQRVHFQHTLATVSSNGNYDQHLLDDCVIESTNAAGALHIYGRNIGRCRYISATPGNNGYPGRATNSTGHAERPFWVDGVRTAATLDPRNGQPVYRASVAWTPGLIAAGAQVTKNLPVTGKLFEGATVDLLVTDMLDRIGYSQPLGGCILSAEVDSTNNILATLTNPTAGGITPAAGTLTGVACKV